MMEKAKSVLAEAKHIPKQKDGVTVVTVENPKLGLALAKDILYRTVDPHTVLFLSGGSQKTLYEQLARDQRITPGAVALVDERYGLPLHAISNEKTISDSGFFDYLKQHRIPVEKILQEGLDREETANNYEQTVKALFAKFPKRVAILGIGVDGHTAGIAPNRPDFQNPMFDDQTSLVGTYHDPKAMSAEGDPSPPNGFGERVTLTTRALAQMDMLLVLGFGIKKNQAFSSVFEQGPVEEVPLRFTKEPYVAPKTLFITDQNV